MNEVAANDDLSCLTTAADHTSSFIESKLNPTWKAINGCLNSLGDDVFQGPAADSCKKALGDFCDVIKNPIIVNFEKISESLKDAYNVLTSTDTKVKTDISFVYDAQGGLQFKTQQAGLTGNTTQDKVLNYLVSKGYSEAAAYGIIANLNAESGCNPSSYNPDDNGAPSFGICQWRAERYNNLQRYCKQKGLDYRSLEGQLDYLVYELQNNYPWVDSYIKGVENTPTGAYNAAYKWTTDFEVCADRYNVGKSRGNSASQLYSTSRKSAKK